MSSFYQRAISQYFGLIIVATAVLGGLAASQLGKVRLDASSDCYRVIRFWLFSKRRPIATRVTNF
jgi:hypothetical protein